MSTNVFVYAFKKMKTEIVSCVIMALEKALKQQIDDNVLNGRFGIPFLL